MGPLIAATAAASIALFSTAACQIDASYLEPVFEVCFGKTAGFGCNLDPGLLKPLQTRAGLHLREISSGKGPAG